MIPRALWLAGLAAVVAACASVNKALESAKPIADVTGYGSYVGTAQKGTQAAGLLAKSTSDFDPDQEHYIGRAVSAQVLSNPKFRQSGNVALQRYVSDVGQAVALGSPSVRPTYQGYRFVVLESPTVNAFSAPGGYVFITTGAIAAAQNEEELAAVLAHEVGHVSLKHGLQSIKQSNVTEALKIIGTEAASRGGVTQLTTVFGDSIQDIVANAVNKGYSRGQEGEADGVAIVFLSEAGYSPQALATYLQRNNFDGGGFRSDHPSAADRVAAVTAAAQGRPTPPGVEARTARFKQAVGGAG